MEQRNDFIEREIQKLTLLLIKLISQVSGINIDNFEIELGIGNWNLSIYNRWGKIVYQSESFTGDLIDIEYNDSMYYYQLVDNYCNKSVKGYFQILR